MRILDDMHYAISSYIRGQIIVSLFIGIMLLIGYLIIGIKYAVLLAILAMIVNIVPYVGLIIAITPTVIIAFIDLASNGFKGNYRNDGRTISRRQIYFSASHGKKLDIHPITIIFIILTARKFIWNYGDYFSNSRVCDIKGVSNAWLSIC